MLAQFLTVRRLIFGLGLLVLLLIVALSWRNDDRLHVYVLNVDGHPALVQTPNGKQILIGGSNSPSGLLSTLGNLMPFWDRDIDLVVVPQANGNQLNGLSAVLDRYAVKQIMAVELPADSRAERDWWALLTQQGHQPIELQAAGLDGVNLRFDGASALLETRGHTIAIGPSEQAEINVIAGQVDRLPARPQLILMWTPVVSDTRVVDLTDRGTLDMSLDPAGLSLGFIR